MAGQTTNYLFDYPTSTDYVKDGATAIQTLATDVDTTLFTALGGAYPGLRLVKKQTIGSAVSSVTVTSAFSATYDDYLLIVSGGVASTFNELTLQLSGITGSVYYSKLIYSVYNSTSVAGTTATATTGWGFCGNGSTSNISANVLITSPFSTKNKSFISKYTNFDSAGAAGSASGICSTTTSATGFTLTPSTGTLTGGTIYVYGYGAS
jgi:hypothetical protein